jgi:hypothetical protein
VLVQAFRPGKRGVNFVDVAIIEAPDPIVCRRELFAGPSGGIVYGHSVILCHRCLSHCGALIIP